MTKYFIVIVSLFLSLTLFAKENQKGGKYPHFIFKATTIDGKNIDLADHIGKKLIMVNFWATWCAPCRYEIPDLINLQEEFKDKLIIVGVSLDRYVDSVKIFSQKYKFNYPVVHDDGTLNYYYGGIASIPTTFIINYEGKIVERIIGARSFDVFKEFVVKYLKKN
ncbi:MAG: TlpA family protein disulfide reductase [Brevinematales bacterium]|nr:TlpA family protein disulfide reductase [Brevinematales bacterium]